MSTRTTLFVAIALVVIAVAFGAAIYNRLPEQIASHWNVNDQVDGYVSKFWGVFLLPLITLGMLGLFLLIPNIDPLKANTARFREVFNLFIALIIAFMIYIYGLMLAWSLGYQAFKMSRAMLPALGLLFLFIGYMLGKARRNWFIGIRTPWTLSSDRVWDETHRLGSILFMISGGFAIIGSFFGGITAFWLIFVPLIGSTVFLVVYSYVLYQREAQ